MLSARLLAFALLAGFAIEPARADESPKGKFDAAKKEYEAAVRTFQRAVVSHYDKLEMAARETGDKKAVDAIKKERDEFTKTGKLTLAVKQLPAIQPMAAAREKMSAAYAAAVKEFTRTKMDDAAAVAEKEWQAFTVSSALLIDKKTYLVSLKHYDVKVENKWFTNNGTQGGHKLKMNSELVPHSICIPPPSKGVSQVRYSLGRKWAALRVMVGVPKIEDFAEPPATPLTFEVQGDGKSLWKSKPVTNLDTFQTCELNVTDVRVLTLLVHCPGANAWARSVWFEPILIEP